MQDNDEFPKKFPRVNYKGIGIAIISIAVLILPPMLGIIQALEESTQTEDGHRITYVLDFMPSVFALVGSNAWFAWIIICAVAILMVTPIVGIILPSYDRNKERKHQIKMKEMEDNRKIRKLEEENKGFQDKPVDTSP